MSISGDISITYTTLLGIENTDITVKSVNTAYKKKAHTLHPDKGGNNQDFVKLQVARDYLINYLEQEAIDKKLNEIGYDYFIIEKSKKIFVKVMDAKITGYGTANRPLIEGTYSEEYFGNLKVISPIE